MNKFTIFVLNLKFLYGETKERKNRKEIITNNDHQTELVCGNWQLASVEWINSLRNKTILGIETYPMNCFFETMLWSAVHLKLSQSFRCRLFGCFRFWSRQKYQPTGHFRIGKETKKLDKEMASIFVSGCNFTWNLKWRRIIANAVPLLKLQSLQSLAGVFLFGSFTTIVFRSPTEPFGLMESWSGSTEHFTAHSKRWQFESSL